MNPDSFTSPEAFGPLSLELSARALVSQHRVPKSGLWKAFSGAPTAAFAAVGYLAQAFALEAALLLKALRERQALQEVARTDPLNGLKAINDREGHAAGDQALKHLARALLGLSRKRDLAFRLGGNEFVSLHPGLKGEDAPALIARLRESLPYSAAAGSLEVGAESPEATLAEADRPMY
jgi:hypothetical protein